MQRPARQGIIVTGKEERLSDAGGAEGGRLLMSGAERTRQEKIGGFIGLLGIFILLFSRILSLGAEARGYAFLAGMAFLMTACCLIGVEQLRKEGFGSKALGGVIFLVIIYNLVFIYRSLFVTRTLGIF